MAYVGDWGCYIHIPHTSGSWTRRVLSQKEGKRSGTTHSLPTVWAHPRYFTIVRDPADWLRSMFCNRRQSRWQEHGDDCPYKDFTRILIPYRTNDFEEFVDSVCTKLPGVVGWLYGCYTPPQVEIVRMGDEQVKYLKKLGFHPERQAPVNVTGNKPELTDKMREQIFKAEIETYGRLGFFMDGSYLKYWSGK